VTRGITPNAVIAYRVRGSLVAAVGYFVFKPPAEFVDYVLEYLSTFLKGGRQAMVGVGGQCINGDLPKILAQFDLRLGPISESSVASRRDDLLDGQLANRVWVRGYETK
jgi:hypothetical protein